ncbi:MAG: Coenzyme F420 hydrogenase/dehydrogenase, beta subunit C-terminal domain [Desulfobacterales bacterium]|nr:Coenzyme F420 hydrogenase/dehydrogenase, beta subunit C-terminal domain [Desulfobacterales bacterium]
MSKTGKLNIAEGDLLGTIQAFFRSVLAREEIGAILVPQVLPMKNVVMPMLVSDPEHLSAADPLAPCFPMNAAKLASRLTRKPAGSRIALVMRPCEIRAFVELVKLNQANTDEVLIIGIDCLGAFTNADYRKIARESVADSTRLFVQNAEKGISDAFGGIELAKACRACEHPIPETADLSIGLVGIDTASEILIEARTEKGEEFFDKLDIEKAPMPASRQQAVSSLVAQRTEFRDRMFAETDEATDSIEKLTAYLGACVNCYNCRVACPVCYCRECVFTTDVFDHEPSRYLRWAARKGSVKMPTDTVFFHVTRIAHMSTACVGCGQCSNACPNEVPVMELFRTLAMRTQKAFDYEAGRNLEEKPPLSEFREDEFKDVVGV